MENLDGRHGEWERGVRGSSNVGISGLSRLEWMENWNAVVYSQAEASK